MVLSAQYCIYTVDCKCTKRYSRPMLYRYYVFSQKWYSNMNPVWYEIQQNFR